MTEAIYLRPKTLQRAALDLAEWGEKSRILAGGTDLLIALRRGMIQPEVILDITGLNELRGIRQQDGLITIGAMTTHGEIQHNAELAHKVPLLVKACREIGSVQIRNLATIGGNIINASPAGDTLPALFVLDAEFHLHSMKGDRWVNVSDFFLGPGKTIRRSDEILTHLRFSPLNGTWKTFFGKIGQRRAMRVSKVSAAGGVCLENERIIDCRLALGAVAPTVIRLNNAEEALIGDELNRDKIYKAAHIASKSCCPIDDIRSTIDYRRAMASVLIRRELEKINNEVKYDR